MPKTDSTTTPRPAPKACAGCAVKQPHCQMLAMQMATVLAVSDDDDAGLDPRLVEELVPDPQVWEELGITSMSGFRWTQRCPHYFPPAIKIRGRNFRSRRMLEAFKKTLIRKALADRAGGAA